MSAWEKVQWFKAEREPFGFGLSAPVEIRVYPADDVDAARAEDAERLKQAERDAFTAGFLANRSAFGWFTFVDAKRLAIVDEAFEAWMKSRQPVSSEGTQTAPSVRS